MLSLSSFNSSDISKPKALLIFNKLIKYIVKSVPNKYKQHEIKHKNDSRRIDDYFDRAFGKMESNEIKYLSVGDITPKSPRGTNDSRNAVKNNENSAIIEPASEKLKSK